MKNERRNFQANQQQRWYRSINWGVHKQLYRRMLDQVVADKAAAEYWDFLYVDVDEDDDQWIVMRLGRHPVDMRGNKFTIEVGGCLSLSRQLDGRVVLALLPCHLEGEVVDAIVLGDYDDPSMVTEAVLQRAIDDFFRVVRVSSAMLSSSRGDRFRVGLLRFHSKYPGREKTRWAATNWPAFVLGSVLGIWGIYLGYVGIAASKPAGMSSDALIRRANPTVLRIVDVGWTHWRGDAEQYLTLTLGNVSHLDALDPKACFLEAPTCEQVANSNGVMAAPKGTRLTIGRDETMRLPVLSESQVRRYLRIAVGVEVDLLGWGLTPQIPVDVEHSCTHLVLDAPPCMANLHSVGIPVRVEWDTTLDEKRSLTTSLYAYVEEARGRTGTSD